jgi:hypothetical protein
MRMSESSTGCCQSRLRGYCSRDRSGVRYETRLKTLTEYSPTLEVRDRIQRVVLGQRV